MTTTGRNTISETGSSRACLLLPGSAGLLAALLLPLFFLSIFFLPVLFLPMGAAAAEAPASSSANATDTLPALSRQDRLLLLDNVARLWQLGIAGIGEEAPAAPPGSPFGQIKNGQLDPAFIAEQSLILTVHGGSQAEIRRLSPEEIRPGQEADQRIFTGIADRFTTYYPAVSQQEAALSYLGWPLQQSASPAFAADILQAKQGFFVDTDSFYTPGGRMDAVARGDVFAQWASDYLDESAGENIGWILEGQVREVERADDGLLAIGNRANFYLQVRKVGTVWRIQELTFTYPQASEE